MGYRSIVILGVNKNHQKEFNKVLENLKSLGICNPYDLFDEVEHTPFSPMKIYRGEYLKWYAEFPEVKAINSFIEDIVDEEKEHPYSTNSVEDYDNGFMICIGEDGAIHSEIGNYYDYVEVYTTHNIFNEKQN